MFWANPTAWLSPEGGMEEVSKSSRYFSCLSFPVLQGEHSLPPAEYNMYLVRNASTVHSV